MRALRTILAIAAGALAAPPGAAQQSAPRDPLALTIDSLRLDPNGVTLAASDVAPGARTVAAGAHVAGDVASWRGPLEIHGTVDGNAVAIGADVIVGKGGRVRGDALSVGGTVKLDGGTVDGETRSLSAITVGAARPQPRSRAQAMRYAVSLSVGWYLVLAVIGLGVLLIVRPHLDAVADAVRDHPMRALLLGVAGQLGLAPGLALLVVALGITIIGLVAVPFAIVGYVAAVAGAVTLGFLAVALFLGYVILGAPSDDRSYGAVLPPLLFGLSLFLILWIAGTAFYGWGPVGVGLRVAATIITWVALTAGFGAVLITRGGTRPVAPPAQIPPAPTAEHEWQTPTPVTGVAAARRPTPAPRPGVRDQ